MFFLRFFLFVLLLFPFVKASSFAIVNLSPVNGSHVYEESLIFDVVGCPVGAKTVLRFSNPTESQFYDLDVSSSVDQTGHILLEISTVALRQFVPQSMDIYWQVISGNLPVQTKGPRWMFRLTDILKPFSLISPVDYSQGSEMMNFFWQSQSGIEWYEVYFSTADGWNLTQKVFTNSLTLNTKTWGFPQNKIISWRVKAFRDGGQNNLWSREWWNFLLKDFTSVSDLLTPSFSISFDHHSLAFFSSFEILFVRVSLFDIRGQKLQSYSGTISSASVFYFDQLLFDGTYFVFVETSERVFCFSVLLSR